MRPSTIAMVFFTGAYQKSLEYDPANKLAVQELLFIAREAKRLGGPQAKAFQEYKPPANPASGTVITECPAE